MAWQRYCNSYADRNDGTASRQEIAFVPSEAPLPVIIAGCTRAVAVNRGLKNGFDIWVVHVLVFADLIKQ